MISFETTGSFHKTESWLKRMSTLEIYRTLERYGQQGVDALSNATPLDSGETADSWYYEIFRTKKNWGIAWKNRHVEHGIPIAVILQYGHATGTGGYVQGRDYINPVILPMFDKMAAEAWKEVTRK